MACHDSVSSVLFGSQWNVTDVTFNNEARAVSHRGLGSTRLLLISDVHANLEALEEVLNHTNFDEVLFVGDIVDYGPNPVEVFDLLRYIRAKRVLGNHDAAASFNRDCRSSPATHAASVATREEITRNSWHQSS